jgi:hypothetical protein
MSETTLGFGSNACRLFYLCFCHGKLSPTYQNAWEVPVDMYLHAPPPNADFTFRNLNLKASGLDTLVHGIPSPGCPTRSLCMSAKRDTDGTSCRPTFIVFICSAFNANFWTTDELVGDLRRTSVGKTFTSQSLHPRVSSLRHFLAVRWDLPVAPEVQPFSQAGKLIMSNKSKYTPLLVHFDFYAVGLNSQMWSCMSLLP